MPILHDFDKILVARRRLENILDKHYAIDPELFVDQEDRYCLRIILAQNPLKPERLHPNAIGNGIPPKAWVVEVVESIWLVPPDNHQLVWDCIRNILQDIPDWEVFLRSIWSKYKAAWRALTPLWLSILTENELINALENDNYPIEIRHSAAHQIFGILIDSLNENSPENSSLWKALIVYTSNNPDEHKIPITHEILERIRTTASKIWCDNIVDAVSEDLDASSKSFIKHLINDIGLRCLDSLAIDLPDNPNDYLNLAKLFTPRKHGQPLLEIAQLPEPLQSVFTTFDNWPISQERKKNFKKRWMQHLGSRGWLAPNEPTMLMSIVAFKEELARLNTYNGYRWLDFRVSDKTFDSVVEWMRIMADDRTNNLWKRTAQYLGSLRPTRHKRAKDLIDTLKLQVAIKDHAHSLFLLEAVKFCKPDYLREWTHAYDIETFNFKYYR